MILLYSCMILTLFQKITSPRKFYTGKKCLLKTRFMMPRCRISGFKQKKNLTIFSKAAILKILKIGLRYCLRMYL